MGINGKILIIDDEVNTLRVLSAILTKHGYEVETAATAEDGLERAGLNDFDLIVTDHRLPGMSGADFIEAFRERGGKTPIIVLTAYGSIEKAVDAMRKGAFSYLLKPVNPDALLIAACEAVEKHRLFIENRYLKTQLQERHNFQNIVGKSRPMQELFGLVETVARSNSSILITGESGTGKELVARALHYASVRAGGPFIPIDCAALPAELLESELFGHERGSFTSAYERKPGQIELAQGGTVFLDEIGELPFGLQKKFLRFLQEREILRVGGSIRIKVDVRIVAATNRDLEARVRDGEFREDLYYRLNVVRITVPSLRERKDDIPLLVRHFLSRFNEENQKTIQSVDPEAMKALMDCGWRGNVRELENAMERAVVLCPSDTITLRHLPSFLGGKTVPVPAEADLNLTGVEKRLLLNALEKTSWNQTRASMLLGISRKQLRTKMKNHGILAPGGEDAS